MARFFKVKHDDDNKALYVNRELVSDIRVYKEDDLFYVSYGLASSGDELGQTQVYTDHKTLEEALAEAAMVAYGDPGDECTPDKRLGERIKEQLEPRVDLKVDITPA